MKNTAGKVKARTSEKLKVTPARTDIKIGIDHGDFNVFFLIKNINKGRK